MKKIREDLAAMEPRWLRRRSAAWRKALVVTVLSATSWSAWNGLRRFDHPWGDLSNGQFTDHFSHMNAARVFPRMGLDIWRVPIADRFRRLTDEEMDRAPEDVRRGASGTGGVFYVPGWPADKPLAVSWSGKTRMYPPGDMLLVAPIAILYHFTGLSLSGACRILIGWFILLAHVALFFFFLNYFEGKGSGVDWLACFFVYSQVMYWTLQGFYDAVAIVPLVLCARYLGRNKGLAAGVAYSAGAMLHFRVFFQAPWALWAVGLMARDKIWQRLRRRDFAAIGIAVLCAGLSLGVFWLDWASLGHVGLNNPLRADSFNRNSGMVWSFKIVLVLCVVALAGARAWFDLVSLAWLALVAFTLRETYFWHFLVSLAWIAAPVRRPMVRGVRIAFLASVVAILFNDPFAPNWLWMLN